MHYCCGGLGTSCNTTRAAWGIYDGAFCRTDDRRTWLARILQRNKPMNTGSNAVVANKNIRSEVKRKMFKSNSIHGKMKLFPNHQYYPAMPRMSCACADTRKNATVKNTF